MKRTYFISYATNKGFDNAFVTIDGPIIDMDDIRKMEKIISKEKKVKGIKILNFDSMLFTNGTNHA